MAQIMTNPARSIVILLALSWALFGAVGCAKPQTIVNGNMDIEVGGEVFTCEIVADNDSRTKGLGNRTELAADKGMIFSFPDSKIRTFVMRDCFIDIDIIFLDPTGRIVAMHAMKVEEPQGDDESDFAYEMRLKKYPSRYNAQYVIELAGGTLERLTLKEGDQIELNVEALQAITQ